MQAQSVLAQDLACTWHVITIQVQQLSHGIHGQVDNIVQGVTGFLDCTAREYERLYVQGVKQGLNLGEAFQEGKCPLHLLYIPDPKLFCVSQLRLPFKIELMKA